MTHDVIIGIGIILFLIVGMCVFVRGKYNMPDGEPFTCDYFNRLAATVKEFSDE